MKWLKKLSLWVRNIVFRWKCNRYQNKFINTVIFLSHDLKDKDKSVILALFNRPELEYRLTEISLMEFLKKFKVIM